MNKLVLLAMGLALIGGCKKEYPNDFRVEAEYEGFCVKAGISYNERHLGVYESCKENLMEQPFLSAIDRKYEEESPKRFDSIELFNVPSGHSLEGYASLEKLEEIYTEVTEGK